MATKKKLFGAAAGAAAGGGALNVEDVFSTYLYYPTGNTHTVTNGIDLSGEGGLVWLKNRLTTSNHELADTERGTTKKLSSNSTAAEDSLGDLSAFNSDGFSLTANNGNAVYNTAEVASWTFRKAPKFFDVVTYSGNSTAGRTVSHNLGTTPAVIMIKALNEATNWVVYHRSLGATKFLVLNDTGAAVTSTTIFNDTEPTATEFTVGTNNKTNGNYNYVAYLFAHNDGDGDFGPTGDQDIIKCGSYTGNGSTDGPEIDLGFEPQWVMIKSSSLGTENWVIFDNMRGVPTGGIDQRLYPNTSGAESANVSHIDFNATGFKLTYGSNLVNSNTNTYIYIAIRRGPMAVPESATDVFAIDTEGSSAPYYNSGFPVDFGLQKRHNAAGDWFAMSRLTQGKFLETNTDNAEATEASAFFDYNDGFVSASAYGSGNSYGWMWRRAPNFFDVVAWTGISTINHNLGVKPEMMWAKCRSAGRDWQVYHKDLGYTKNLKLSSSLAAETDDRHWAAEPTDSVFYVGGEMRTGDDNIAYLFASLDGISKVGSYTGNGGTQNIDCGFSSGARFVLIKGADYATNWYVFDTERGIVAGNDAEMYLDSTAAEATTRDLIDPYSAGFTMTGNGVTNTSGKTYIYYAVS